MNVKISSKVSATFTKFRPSPIAFADMRNSLVGTHYSVIGVSNVYGCKSIASGDE